MRADNKVFSILIAILICSSVLLTYLLVDVIDVAGRISHSSKWDSMLARMEYNHVCELYFELVDPLARMHPDAECAGVPLSDVSYDDLVKKAYKVRVTPSPDTESMRVAIAYRFNEIGVEACTKATDVHDPVLWRYYGDYRTFVRSEQANDFCAQRRIELERTTKAR